MKIVLDGGPCAGKTTMLSIILERVQQLGFYPFIVPEAATALFSMGFHPKDMGGIPFQRAIVDIQLRNENFIEDYATKLAQAKNKKPLIIYDRGMLTGAAYLDQKYSILEEFQSQVLEEFGLTVESTRARYEGVIYLDSAALGAEEYYTLTNNAARTETVEEARVLNEHGKKAWLGHPHLCVIPNTNNGKSISFEEKKRLTISELYRLIGVPIPIELEKKYLLKDFDPESITVPFEVIDIEQRYLVPKEKYSEERVRRRSWLGGHSFFHTIKSPGPNNARFEIEKNIQKKEYDFSLANRVSLNKYPIKKKRYCFLWNNQYFEVDIFLDKLAGLKLVEIEHTEENSSIDLPDFLNVERDVTNETFYKNSYLASLSSYTK